MLELFISVTERPQFCLPLFVTIQFLTTDARQLMFATSLESPFYIQIIYTNNQPRNSLKFNWVMMDGPYFDIFVIIL